MRIIEKKPYGIEFTCSGCGSRLEANGEDVVCGKFGHSDDYKTKYYVKCPVCGTPHFPNHIPPKVMLEADKRARQ